MPTSINVGGVWHNWTPSINLGGAWHSATMWLNVGGVWKAISGWAFNITAALYSGAGTGYASDHSPAYGTLNSGGTSQSGKTLIHIVDPATGGSSLSVKGFASDPGQASLTSLISNGVTLTGSGASSYSYSPTTQTAFWNWSASLGYANATAYNGIISAAWI